MNNRRTALITGGSSGIGLELAKLFAKDGYVLVLVASEIGQLNKAAKVIEKEHGVTVRVIAKDLSRHGAAAEIFNELQAAGVQVDALVNDAGSGLGGEFANLPLEEQIQTIELNVRALTEFSWLFLRPMIARQRGEILNVASVAGFQPGPLMAVYYATKAYTISFSEALHYELRNSGIAVTTLCPGPTRTAFSPRAKMENSRMFSHPLLMEPATVALEGYRGLKAGRMLVITGVRNKLISFLSRIAPQKVVLAVVNWLHHSR